MVSFVQGKRLCEMWDISGILWFMMCLHVICAKNSFFLALPMDLQENSLQEGSTSWKSDLVNLATPYAPCVQYLQTVALRITQM